MMDPQSSLNDESLVVRSGEYRFRVNDRINKSKLIRGDFVPQCGAPPRPIIAQCIKTESLPAFLAKEGAVLHWIHNQPHPSLPKLRATVETSQCSFIVTDVVGQNLATHLRSHGRIQEPEALRLFRQLVSAVAHLHQKKIVLKRLRIDNVFFVDDSKASLIIPDLPGAEVICRSHEGLTCRSGADVYCLGVILFAMLTGCSYRRSTPNYLPRDLSHHTRELLKQLLSRDLFARPTSKVVLESLIIPLPFPTSSPGDSLNVDTFVDARATTKIRGGKESMNSVPEDCDQIVPDVSYKRNETVSKRKRSDSVSSSRSMDLEIPSLRSHCAHYSPTRKRRSSNDASSTMTDYAILDPSLPPHYLYVSKCLSLLNEAKMLIPALKRRRSETEQLQGLEGMDDSLLLC